jgi:hypothetical protein
VRTKDAQVRKLMEEMSKHGQVGLASLRAGMDRKTGRKYVGAGKLPSELESPRTWRTREDPFAEDWAAIEAKLAQAPELEAKTLFDELLAKDPERYEEGQLRTLQRRIKQWRAGKDPDKAVFFAQEHRPGEAAQTDFTWCTELGITIAGELFVHMLCVLVLPFSNWQWVTVCLSESMAALRRGVQAALFRLGRVPTFHQTDHSTAATHTPTHDHSKFNEEYLALMRHLGMEPRTTGVGEKEQNGDVESSNGALKRRLEQQLLLRQSRDFDSREVYERWVQDVVDKGNRPRAGKLAEELAVMRQLAVSKLPEYTEIDVGVSAWSTIRVKFNAYSVPSRLIGETVRARVYDDRIEISYGGQPQLTVERLRGRQGHRINYRHIIWSLVQKPGAFARYKYRDDLFPTVTFRRAYDALQSPERGIAGDLDYLRILHLAASTMEADVEVALALLLSEHKTPKPDLVKAMVASPRIEVPALAAQVVDLHVYDALLATVVAS